MTDVPVQRFPVLEDLAIIQHGFTLRVPGLDIKTDRATALERISGYHRTVLKGLGPRALRIAEQVHGNGVAVVDRGSPEKTSGVDALITNDAEVVLGIYVADCCAIYFADPVRKVIGIAHSGRKGTEQNIAGMTLERMTAGFGSAPEDLLVQLSPCIRPPFYEVDFAAQIVAQLQAGGVRRVYDCGENTGADLERFYSYRMEKGSTGRMLAFLALTQRRPRKEQENAVIAANAVNDGPIGVHFAEGSLSDLHSLWQIVGAQRAFLSAPNREL